MRSNFDLGLDGKVAVITGAASGIGKATAYAFADCGADLGLIDINQEKGDSLIAAMSLKGKSAVFYGADVADSDDIETAIAYFHSLFGNIDILVNNAGIEINDRGNIVTMRYDEMMRILEVNLLGAIHCVRSIVPRMEKPGGCIVNVTSIQGIAAHSPGTMYQVTKAALIGLTHALAIELGPRGIRVNAIAPGAVATEGMGAIRGTEPGIKDAYRKRIPIRRRAHAHEIAETIVALCSDKLTSYVNGAVIVADGGYSINLTPDSLVKNLESVEDDPDL